MRHWLRPLFKMLLDCTVAILGPWQRLRQQRAALHEGMSHKTSGCVWVRLWLLGNTGGMLPHNLNSKRPEEVPHRREQVRRARQACAHLFCSKRDRRSPETFMLRSLKNASSSS